MSIKWGLALVALAALGACGSKSAGLPEKRPADLHVRYWVTTAPGQMREIVIDADGRGVLKEDEYTDAFEVTDAELDALWKAMRDAHLERLPPPAGGVGIEVTFGVRTIQAGTDPAFVDPIETLATKVYDQSE